MDPQIVESIAKGGAVGVILVITWQWLLKRLAVDLRLIIRGQKLICAELRALCLKMELAEAGASGHDVAATYARLESLRKDIKSLRDLYELDEGNVEDA